MKRSFLAIGALMIVGAMNAQTTQATTTYVGQDSQLFLSKDALWYSQGNFQLDSNREKSVENKGNVAIVGNYTKGNNNTENEGKEFVNVYTGRDDYGQTKILSTSDVATARMTVQRPAATDKYLDTTYEMSIPYSDTAKYLMHSFGKQETDFVDGCPKDQDCGGQKRYKLTLVKWNNNKLQHDPIGKDEGFEAGGVYNLGLKENHVVREVMKEKLSKSENVDYKGTPTGKSYTQRAKGVIPRFTEKQFSSAKYKTWMKLTNQYNERYESYLGAGDAASGLDDDRLYGKNTYRFGNPYTSNLDLSDFGDKNAPWLKIKNNGLDLTIKQATDNGYIEKFTIRKRTDKYDDNWGKMVGTLTMNYSMHQAEFNGTQWTGDAEALIVRPTETFELFFAKIKPEKLGMTRIMDVEVSFNDNHKTFDYVPSAKSTDSKKLLKLLPATTTSSRASRPVVSLAGSPEVSHDFHQLKIHLLQNNTTVGMPVFLVGADYKNVSAEKTEGEFREPIFLYGAEEGTSGEVKVGYESKKIFNEFNSLSYTKKPLAVGLNGLEVGKTYQLGFKAYNDNIFNAVDGKTNFILFDTKTNKGTRINTDELYTFEADEDMAKRFVIYWKDLPEGKVLSTANVERATQTTLIYEEAGKSKIRFENISNLANVSVYNASGRLVNTTNNVPTNIDYALDVNFTGVYMVKVTYRNGEVRTLKFVNK